MHAFHACFGGHGAAKPETTVKHAEVLCRLGACCVDTACCFCCQKPAGVSLQGTAACSAAAEQCWNGRAVLSPSHLQLWYHVQTRCVLRAVESSGKGVGLSMPWLML